MSDEMEVVPAGERRLAELEMTPGLWLALGGSRSASLAFPPGIRFRWDPALVAKLGKVDGGKKWGEEPRWVRIMPQLITWRVL